jgi:hypothetical protein
LRTTRALESGDAVRCDDDDASVRLPWSKRLHEYDDADAGPRPSKPQRVYAYDDASVRLPWSKRLHEYDADADEQVPPSSCAAWQSSSDAPSRSSWCSLRLWSFVESNSCDESMTSCGYDDEVLVRFQPWFPLWRLRRGCPGRV